MNQSKPDLLFTWGTLILLAFIWGSSFILMKIGLVEIPYQEVGALRMLVAFVSLIPFGIGYWARIEKKYWKYLFIIGLFGNGLPAFLFAYAQSYINSSLAGMLNSLVPLFTLVLGIFIFQFTPKRIHILGVITGLIGAIFLLYRPGMSFDSDSVYGLYIVAATLCYATSVNTIKKYVSHLPSSVITSTSLMFIGPPCGIYLFAYTDFTDRFSFDPAFMKSFIAIIVLSVMATGFALILFNMLIKKVSALYASSVTYLIPIVAIIWGVVDGESIAMMQLAGMSAILGGIYLINK